MNNFNTITLRAYLESKGAEYLIRALHSEDIMGVVMMYHLARTADALERLAHTFENNQIASLEGPDIVNRLTDISLTIAQIREQMRG